LYKLKRFRSREIVREQEGGGDEKTTTLIVKELTIGVELGRVVTILNMIKHYYF
jgi:hypothetical protein